MLREVTVTTGARLHFGLLAHGRAQGRQFGGVGLMIDSPGVRLIARRATEDAVTGDSASAERVRRFVSRYRAQCPPDRQPPPAGIEVVQALPPHAGLGSGTQLGLAVAQALALLAGEGEVDAPGLARRVERGERSSLGIHGFARGGFLIEAGKKRPDDIGIRVVREDFPEAWRAVLITPAQETGLAGQDERHAFARLPSMSQSITDRLCCIALVELAPAVLEADFPTFGDALFEYGRLAGDSFAAVQGGVYASRRAEHLVEHLRRSGIRGVAQSSWGPTLCAFAADDATARQLARDLQSDSCWSGCRCHIAGAMNTGAILQMR